MKKNEQPVWWWWYTPEEAKQSEPWIEDCHLQRWENAEKGTIFYMLSYSGLVEADRREMEAFAEQFEKQRKLSNHEKN